MAIGAILWALVWVILALVALLMLALILPVRLEMHLRADRGWNADALVRPFGRFGPGVRLQRRAKQKPAKPARKPKPARDARPSPVNLAPAALRLVSELLACIHLERLCVHATFGCADPADTGALYGQLVPLAQVANGLPKADIQLAPAFGGTELDMRAELTLSARPIALVAPFARFGWAFLRARP